MIRLLPVIALLQSTRLTSATAIVPSHYMKTRLGSETMLVTCKVASHYGHGRVHKNMHRATGGGSKGSRQDMLL